MSQSTPTVPPGSDGRTSISSGPQTFGPTVSEVAAAHLGAATSSQLLDLPRADQHLAHWLPPGRLPASRALETEPILASPSDFAALCKEALVAIDVNDPNISPQVHSYHSNQGIPALREDSMAFARGCLVAAAASAVLWIALMLLLVH